MQCDDIREVQVEEERTFFALSNQRAGGRGRRRGRGCHSARSVDGGEDGMVDEAS